MDEVNQHDTVTGLPNRTHLWTVLDETLKHNKRHGSIGGILLIKIANLEIVRDKIGEQGVDQYLKILADRLSSILWDLDVVVRFEEDSFVLVANSITRQEDIHIVMNKVRDYLAIDCDVNENTISTEIRISIVLLPTDASDVDDIMTNASTTLKLLNGKTKNNYCYYNEDLGSKIEELETIKTSILDTLAQESFVLLMQPKIDTITRKVCGAEALVRMRDSDGDIVEPGEFIPVAENSQLILKIGDWVLEKVQKLNAEWRSKGVDLPISVNISDVQFKNGAALLATLNKIVENDPECAKNIILEISEITITNDVALATALLAEIKSYGFQISIDGFGAGFTGLSVLRDLKIDEIKIDRQFLNHVPSDEKNTAILKSIIMLGKSMDFRVVVVGVETEAQFELLKSHNCDEFQGFLISKPIDADLFNQWRIDYDD